MAGNAGRGFAFRYVLRNLVKSTFGCTLATFQSRYPPWSHALIRRGFKIYHLGSSNLRRICHREGNQPIEVRFQDATLTREMCYRGKWSIRKGTLMLLIFLAL